MIEQAAAILPRLLTRSVARRIAVGLPAVGLAYVVLGFVAQRYLTYPGSVLRRSPADQGSDEIERLVRQTEVGPVESWFLPARGGADRAAPLVVFFHGNGGLIDDLPDLLARYREMGCHVLLPEYRGYGRSAGRPGRRAIVEDARHFISMVRSREAVDDARIIYHGFSIGGGVACAVAKRLAPAGLILQSTFTSTQDVASRVAYPASLVREKFNNLPIVAALNCPLLVMHGRRDPLIPLAHGRLLVEVARRGELLIHGAGHDCQAMLDASSWARIGTWLKQHDLIERQITHD